ncbi:MAG: hypothetical protein ACK5NQ_04045 [Pseudomonas sp.]
MKLNALFCVRRGTMDVNILKMRRKALASEADLLQPVLLLVSRS